VGLCCSMIVVVFSIPETLLGGLIFDAKQRLSTITLSDFRTLRGNGYACTSAFIVPKIDDALLTWPCKTLSWLTFGHCIVHVAIPHYLLHVIFLELNTSRLIFSSGLSKKISIWAELRLFTRASKRKR